MTRADVAFISGFILLFIGVVLVISGKRRGQGRVSGMGLEVSGGAGILLCALGIVMIFYNSKGGGECWINCPPPPPPPAPIVQPDPRRIAYPEERITRAGDGVSGRIWDVQISLLPPDKDNPNGTWGASWMYTGYPGSHGGGQSIVFTFKSKNGVDLYSEPFPLARDGCQYNGGIRQQKPIAKLNQPIASIGNVTIETTILKGDQDRC